MRRERGSTIERVLALLSEIADAEKPITATELNENLDLPKATAHRICAVLEELGYLQRKLDGKRLMPGPKLQNLAVGVLSHSQHRIQRHAVLSSLSYDIGETCNIAYPDGSAMIYSDRVESQWPLRLQLPVGTSVPLHCTASGKIYLSCLPRSKWYGIASKLTLTAHTRNTIRTAEKLVLALEEVCETQIGIDNEEFVEGMIALSVPIKDKIGRFYGAVAFHAPVVRMSMEVAEKHIPRLKKAANDLAKLVTE